MKSIYIVVDIQHIYSFIHMQFIRSCCVYKSTYTYIVHFSSQSTYINVHAILKLAEYTFIYTICAVTLLRTYVKKSTVSSRYTSRPVYSSS